jgi:predicted phage tail protein
VTALAVPALREVRLYGALGRQFGRVFRLAVASPAEAVQALVAVLPGFEKAFLGRDGQAAYHVYVGRGSQRRTIAEADAVAVVGATEPIRFVPEVKGAKSQGGTQVILGWALTWAGYFLYAAGFAPLGAMVQQIGYAMILGGVVQLLSPQRQGKEARQENQPSYAFDGPVNNAEQGGPVPLAYGRVICGSTVVSQGMATTEIAVPAPAPMPEPELPPWEGAGPGNGYGGDGGGG